MQKRKLAINSVIVWKFNYIFIAVVSYFFIGCISVFSISLSIIISIIGTVFLFFIIFFYPSARYNNTEYYINTNILRIDKGVIFKKEIMLKTSSIQYIDSIQTPIQKFFKTYTLIFYTAGSKISLGQLDLQDIDYLKNYYLEDKFYEI